MRNVRVAVAIVALTGLAGAAQAQLTVDTNLGSLGIGSSTNIVGTSIGGTQIADLYASAYLGQNWIYGFDATLSERVYEFTLTSDSRISITNNEGIFVGADNDHYLLRSLGVSGGFASAIGFIDEEGAIGNYRAGTYYLAVDTYGLGGNVDGAFDIDLNISAITAVAPNAIDLGVVGNAGDALSFNTIGSDYDTEIAIYDDMGNLLAANDDAVGTQSEIAGDSVAEGVYYIAVGGFNSIFDIDFGATGGDEAGNLLLAAGSASFSGTTSAGEISWFTVTVIPTPASMALLGLGAVAGVRRRR